MTDKKYTGMNVETETWEYEGKPCSKVTIKDKNGKEVYSCTTTPNDYIIEEAEKDGLTDVWSRFFPEEDKMYKGYTDKKGITHTEEYKKGKLQEAKLDYEDKDGVHHYETYDGKGKLLRSVLEYTDEKGVGHTEKYDAKGKLLESHLSYEDEKGIKHFETYDEKGKLSSHSTYKNGGTAEHEEATDYFDKKGKFSARSLHRKDKDVVFDMKRGKLSALVSFIDPALRWRGGKMGKVSEFQVSDKRADTNKKLSAILKDGSLTGEEKKTKMREVAAEYHAGKYAPKAPNAKVGAALGKYLPPKQGGR